MLKHRYRHTNVPATHMHTNKHSHTTTNTNTNTPRVIHSHTGHTQWTCTCFRNLMLRFPFSEYKGGETVFYSESPSPSIFSKLKEKILPAAAAEKEAGWEERVIVPRVGTCVLFTHDVQHEGRNVTEGHKFILR